MPLQRRVPKFGFNNVNRVEYKVINISDLENLAAKLNVTDINLDVIRQAGLASKSDLVKVLGDGKLTVKVNVTAHKFSGSAREKISAAGGSATEL
jgi:large subunit ribosomal protein L15